MIERNELAVIMRSVRNAMDVQNAAAVATMAAMALEIKELREQLKAIPAGPAGPQGPQGESIKGDQGPAGKDAPPVDLVKLAADAAALIPVPENGRDGLNGKDADPEIVKEYVSLAVSQAVAAIPAPKDGAVGPAGPQGMEGPCGPAGPRGEQGEKGQDGLAGKDGAQGIAGEHGESGKDGKDGAPGERGSAGEKGLDGKDGRDGRDGADGRDSADIVIHEFDPSRTYPRLTFAAKDGGLCRFDGKDWQVIVRGLQSLEVIRDEEDLRVITVRSVLTGGFTEEKRFRIPLMIHRGIYKDGTEYERGDAVTFDNSCWVCQVDTTKAIPGRSPDWQLAVRKGGPGRDGINGKDGEPGPQGPPGKDLRYK